MHDAAGRGLSRTPGIHPMSTLFVTAPTAPRAIWTAAEFTAAVAPHLFSTLADPAVALAPLTRRAHVIAVSAGLSWNPSGRYPISVWTVVYA
jgi:hypothetical protein